MGWCKTRNGLFGYILDGVRHKLDYSVFSCHSESEPTIWHKGQELAEESCSWCRRNVSSYHGNPRYKAQLLHPSSPKTHFF